MGTHMKMEVDIYISVYLAISGTSSLPAGWEVNAVFTFFMFDQLRDNYLSVRGKMRRFQPIKSLWGLAKFLSHDTFKEASNGYLVDDKCVLGAEIFVVQRQAIGECLSMMKSTDSIKREWKRSVISPILAKSGFLKNFLWMIINGSSGCFRRAMETVRDVISQYF